MDEKLAETIEILRQLSDENQRIFIDELHQIINDETEKGKVQQT